jgi:hypothetical protein
MENIRMRRSTSILNGSESVIRGSEKTRERSEVHIS